MWKIAPPFEHLKIKIIQNLMSPDAVSGMQKVAIKYVCGRSCALDLAVVAYNAPPDSLAGFRGTYF